MSHTGSTRVSFRTVAILVGLLAAMLIGPAPIKAADPLSQVNRGVDGPSTDAYIFAPTGVTLGQEVRLTYHNFTKGQVKVRFVLLDANGQDLFAVNKINATFIVEPGTMGMVSLPCDQILGANKTRVEVTGAVALWRVPPQLPVKAGSFFIGPASLQIVDELTQETRLLAGTVGPIDLVGIVTPVD